MIFKSAGFFDNDMDSPISKDELLDPNSHITKTILYIYSMETFISELLNKASYEKDYSKIETL